MRKLLFLFCIAALSYTAGLFHLASLMAAAITAALFFPVMWILCRYLKGRLRLEINPGREPKIQGAKGNFMLMAENSGRLPVNLFCTEVYAAYVREMTGNKAEPLQHFTGAVGAGETITREICAELPRCGLVEIQLKRSAVFDYFRLFTGRIVKAKGCIAAVFPRTSPARIYLFLPWAAGLLPEEQNEPFSLGAENGEYCQLREYQEGDPSRKIHWKKSAAGNQLWVREYGTEQEFLRLILDFRGFHQRSADEISAFYELLYSLLTGLLAENCLIAVSWLIGTGEEQQFSIHRQEDMDELLWILYRQEPLFDFGQNKTRRVTSAEAGEELCLDAELRLYRQGKLIGSFSIPEIREGRVSVYLQGEER